MKISKRVMYSLLMMTIMVNFILRYPTSDHENGTDSLQIHAWSLSILSKGHAVWLVHPLSYFGFYPYSYASGTILLVSTVTLLTNIESELTAFVLPLIVTIMGVSMSFIFLHGQEVNKFIAFIFAFLFTTSRTVVSWSDWNIDPYFIFLYFVLILSFFMSKFFSKYSIKYFILSFVTFIILLSFHRIALFSILIFASFVSSMLFLRYQNTRVFNFYPKIVYLFLFTFIFLSPMLFDTVFISNLYETSAFDQGGYYSNFFSGEGLLFIILNMIAWYSMSIGILTPLCTVGFISLLFKKRKRRFDIFLFTLLVFLALLLSEFRYGKVFSLFLIIIFMSIGFYEVMKYFDRIGYGITFSIAIFILLFSALIPLLVLVVPPESEDIVTESDFSLETYNTGIYMREYFKEEQKSIQSIYLSRQLGTIVGPPFYNLPIETIDFKAISSSNLKDLVSVEKKFIIVVDERFIDFRSKDCDNALVKLNFEGQEVLVVQTIFDDDYYFYKTVEEKKYKVYDSDYENVHYLSY